MTSAARPERHRPAHRLAHRATAAFSGLAIALAVLAPTTSAAVAAPGDAVSDTTRGHDRDRAPDRTSRAEARRVDRVPTPEPVWSDCGGVFVPGSECALVELPLDYDQPHGATTSIAVLRVRAADPANRIGTLFVNPGGPGGSGVEAAADASVGLPPDVLARFDIVGFDPRGTNYGDRVECFTDPATQATVEAVFESGEVFGPAGEAAAVDAARTLGRACSRHGGELAGSMSTAQVARDMDVLRRMVGDAQLTYLGFSYGSYLGTVYANLFPDRVRAVIIDGVDDPLAWSGTGNHDAGRRAPQEAMLRTGDADQRAVTEILDRCTAAGPEYCELAGVGDPTTLYTGILTRLEADPAVVTDPETGVSITFSRAALQGLLGAVMATPDAGTLVDSMLMLGWALSQPPGEEGSELAAAQEVARATVLAWDAAAKADAEGAAAVVEARRAAFGLEPARPNDLEATTVVTCTDGLHPRDAARWPDYAAATDATSAGFGRFWTWTDAPCASKTWTVRDEDTYLDRFTHRTASPVLVLGSYWDPSTRYEGAVATSRLLPNSRLLSNDNWGHTALGTSACVDDAVAAYLLTGAVPARGAVCTGDVQPFTTPLGASAETGPGAGPDAGSAELPPLDSLEPDTLVEPPTTVGDVMLGAGTAA